MVSHPPTTPSSPPRDPGSKRLLKALLILLLSVVFVCVGALVFLRLTLTGEQLARLVFPRMQRDLGMTVTYSSCDLVWLSADTARFTVHGVTCDGPPGSGIHSKVQTVAVELRLLPLAWGSLSLERVQVVEPFLVLPRTPIEWDRGYPADRLRGTAAASFLRPVVRLFTVESGRVQIAEDPRSGPLERLFEGIQVEARNVRFRGVEYASVRGSVPHDNGAGSFQVLARSVSFRPRLGRSADLEVMLTGCQVRPFRALLATLGHDMPLAGGLADLRIAMKGSLKDCHIDGWMQLQDGQIDPRSIFLRRVLVDRARAKFAAEVKDGTLHVDVRELTLPGLNLSLEVRVPDFLGDQPRPTITVKALDLDLGRFGHLVPLGLLKPEDRKSYLDAGVRGRVMTKGTWIGTLEDLQNGELVHGIQSVEAFLENVSGFVPGLNAPLKDASGRVQMNSQEASFQGVRLTLGNSPIQLNGAIKDLGASPSMDLFVSLNATAQDLRPILDKKTVAARLPASFQKLKEPTGRISMQLALKGRLKEPSVEGKLSLNEFSCGIEGLPLPLRNIKGSVSFAGSQIIFSSIKGLVGKTEAELNGEYSPGNMKIDVVAKTAPSDLVAFRLLPASVRVTGPVSCNLTLKGKPQQPNFSGRLDFDKNRVLVGWVVDKKPGIPLALEAAGTWSADGLKIEEGYLSATNVRVSIKGSVDASGHTVLNIHLPPRGVLTQQLVPLAAPALELEPGGRIEGDATIKAGPDRSQWPSVEANLTLSHVSAQIFNLPKPSKGLTAKIRWRENSFHAAVERAKMGNSLFSGTCSISDFSNPTVQVKLDFSFLDTTDFARPPGYVSPHTWGEWLQINPVILFLARSKGGAVVKAAKGKTQYRTFSDFDAHLTGEGGMLRVPEWKLSFADGALRGSGLFNIRANARTPLRIDFRGDHLKIERTAFLDPNYLKIEGDMWVDGHMEWHTTPKRENNGVYKTGSAEVRLKDGMIYRFEVLSKIFSLINFGSIVRGRFPDLIAGGLPYRRLVWNMDVHDERWKVKDLKLESDSAHIDSTGMYFADQGRIDFRVNVAPLVGLDTLFSGIFGNLFSRNGKILTTTFLVSGPSHSPDVRLAPLGSYTPMVQ
ncbi:MAG: AsmA-like C-terminal domain-containing protein [Thermodesulfobacteriota bacterium]